MWRVPRVSLAYGAIFALGLSGVAGGIVAVLLAMAIALPLFAVAVRIFRRQSR